MPLIETKGAASAQGFGEFTKKGVANYIEDVFSTWLYTGNGSTQTITNGIDLSTNGGLVWSKCRSVSRSHALFDTNRGVNLGLGANLTNAQFSLSGVTAFNSTGFSLGADAQTNFSGDTFTSWTFRKQPKFFDVVTYTGTGANRTVAHNLGSVPGCIITKRTDTTGNWITYHRSLGNTDFVNLNTTAATSADSGAWNNTTPTSTEFSLGTGNTNVNGGTYVAYLFAHNAGGFGLTGTDNVISCGSYTGNGSTAGPTITLGYEPQWLLVKPSSASGSWYMIDTMRGFNLDNDNPLFANNANVEAPTTIGFPTATGFTLDTTGAPNISGATYIYIAIRRGPMKTPTTGTSVFNPVLSTGTSADITISTTILPDAFISLNRASPFAFGAQGAFQSRLTGSYLITSSTDAEASYGISPVTLMSNTGFSLNADSTNLFNYSGQDYVYETFRRAPGFFDVVCYTGTGANRTVTHGLGVVPELIIVKSRGVQDWPVYSAALGANNRVRLNQTNPSQQDLTLWNNTAPTSSVFSLGTATESNQSAVNYVAYLFATCAGVSKVGSYTGTGATLQINCGFTGGARFVLIKRTNISGDWYVWDSARGIVAGNDPYLLLNSTAAEVTTTDWVDTYSAGFELSNAAGNLVNVNGNSYIFLAIA